MFFKENRYLLFLWQTVLQRLMVPLLMMVQFAFLSPFYYLIYYTTIKNIIDTATSAKGIAWHHLFPFVLLFIMGEVFFSIIFRINDFGYRNFFSRASSYLTETLYEKICAADYSFFKEHLPGTIVSRIDGVLSSSYDCFTTVLQQILPRGMLILFFVGYIFLIHHWLGLFIFFWILLYLLVLLFFSVRLVSLSVEANNEGYAVISRIADYIVNIYSVLTYVLKKDSLKVIHHQNNHRYITAWLKQENYFIILQFIAQFFYLLLVAFMIMYTVNLLIDKVISAGEFVIVINFLFFIIEHTWHFVIEIQRVLKKYGNLQSSLDPFFAMHYDEDAGTMVFSEKTMHITFAEVKFFYKKSEKQALANYHAKEIPVFHHISFSITSGQHVAFVGASGSGKSTIVSLLLRFFEPTSGSISINNRPITTYTKDSLRDQIAVIPQEIILFSTTIYENIACGKKGATADEVYNAAKIAQIHDFIEQLPEKYATSIGELGIGISGGQKQRIALARAFLKDPLLIIFDEATAALDFSTELKLQQSFSDAFSKKNKTMITITHRFSHMSAMDSILVLDGGTIVESGTHNELMEKKGVYYERYVQQLGEPYLL